MKKGQVTIFVILGILIIFGILLFFFLKGDLFKIEEGAVPTKIRPFHEAYSLCLENLGEEAVQLAGQRGGNIYFLDEQGSSFMPFGNHLDFLGDEIPYWFYISDNGIKKHEIPTLTSMQADMQAYIEENFVRCDSVIAQFKAQGFDITERAAENIQVTIRDDDVFIRIIRPLDIKIQNSRTRINTYNIEVAKSLGRSYKAAKKIMEAENNQLFIEERTIDTIFLYDELPSTKTTIECVPKSYTFLEVTEHFKNVLAHNIPFTRIKGTDYNTADDYFEIDANVVDNNLGVNFLFIDEPFKLEINGKEQGILRGESISDVTPPFLKSFLCLSSYSFTYTVGYPVLVSMYDKKTDFLFQFPFVVFVNKNNPREAEDIITLAKQESKVCENKLAKETVITLSSEGLAPIDNAIINYKCINTVCPIGITTLENGQAKLTGEFPQCVNGFVIVEKDGYVRAKEQFSTNIDNQEISIILEPLNELDVELILINNLGGERKLKAGEEAIITFLEEDKELSDALAYPDENTVKLADGSYKVRIHVFKDSPLSLEKQEIEKCFKVPAPGIGGLLGFKQEKCQTFEFPAQNVDQVLFGGAQFTFTAEVSGKSKLTLYAIENPVPVSIDDLNAIYADIELNKDSPLFKVPEVT